MSTFKKTKVVMLSTNEKATVDSIVTRPSDNRMAIVNVLTKDDTQPCIHQQLYFLSDEEIKEGDWMLHNLDEKPIQWNGEETNPSVYGYKKIIATTDEFLSEQIMYYPDGRVIGGLESYKILPQPSQSFLDKFVEEYNKGNQITEVLVEYENIDMDFDPAELNGIKWKNKSKINPKNNTITIKEVENA